LGRFNQLSALGGVTRDHINYAASDMPSIESVSTALP
jgi:hypothetical protein